MFLYVHVLPILHMCPCLLCIFKGIFLRLCTTQRTYFPRCFLESFSPKVVGPGLGPSPWPSAHGRLPRGGSPLDPRVTHWSSHWQCFIIIVGVLPRMWLLGLVFFIITHVLSGNAFADLLPGVKMGRCSGQHVFHHWVLEQRYGGDTSTGALRILLRICFFISSAGMLVFQDSFPK